MTTSIIIGILQSKGCKILRYDDYVFKFLFGDRFYSVCAQNGRVVGSFWVGGQPTEKEAEMFNMLPLIKIDNPDLYDKIVGQYSYRDFVIYGCTVDVFDRLMDWEFGKSKKPKGADGIIEKIVLGEIIEGNLF